MSLWYAQAGIDVVRGNPLRKNWNAGWQNLNKSELYSLGVVGDSGANYCDLGTLTAPADLTRISSLTLATPMYSAVTMQVRSCLFDTNSSTSGAGYAVAQGYTNADRTFCYNGTSFLAEGGAGTFQVGKQALYGTSYSKAANLGSIYKNGALISSGAYDSAVNVSYGTLCIGGRASNSANLTGFGGTVRFNALFYETLSEAEFRRIGLNPWQLLAAQRRFFLFANPAGPAAVTRSYGYVMG
jgi:hypothetical protein